MSFVDEQYYCNHKRLLGKAEIIGHLFAPQDSVRSQLLMQPPDTSTVNLELDQYSMLRLG
jgi:hypothetical protein